MKLYVECDANEELPDKNDFYHTEPWGLLGFDIKRRVFYDENRDYKIDSWFKPITREEYLKSILPSEEEIEKTLIGNCHPDMRTYNPETGRAVFRILETDCDKAAKSILSLLTEKNQ